MSDEAPCVTDSAAINVQFHKHAVGQLHILIGAACSFNRLNISGNAGRGEQVKYLLDQRRVKLSQRGIRLRVEPIAALGHVTRRA